MISILCGKKIFMPLLGHRYPRITLPGIQQYTEGLDVVIVGGLQNRGWTCNDIDVLGSKQDAKIFDERLKKNGVMHPVHYCGPLTNHSHVVCAFNGIKLALTGRGY